MKYLKLFQDRYFALLAICIAISSVISFWYLTQQTVFGYDMARDAFYAYDIGVGHNLKILGPGTDIVGLNHGVLWYYALTIPYLIARQDPQYAVIFFFILSYLTMPFVWLLSYKLFDSRKVAFVSTVLYAFSPLVVSFSSWMSNPVLCLYASPPLLISIFSYWKNRSAKTSFLIGLFYGVLIQSQLANLIILVTIPMYILFLRIRLRIKDIATFLLGFGLMLSSFLLVELKFGGRGIDAIFEYIKNGHGGHFPRSDFIFGKFVEFFRYAILPLPIPFILIFMALLFVGLILAFKSHRKPIAFLLIWLSNIWFFTLFDTGVSHSYFVFIPSIAAGLILISFLIVKYLKFSAVIAVFVFALIIIQIITVNKWVEIEFSPAAIQRSNTIRRYKQVIDYTYRASKGDPFIINASTSPLYISTVWEYLYQFYGMRKYGYQPFWGGKSQKGYQGNLVEKAFGEKYRYLILESPIGIDEIYPVKAVYEEERVGDLVEQKQFGEVAVQKRIFHKDKKEIEIPQPLKDSHVLYE